MTLHFGLQLDDQVYSTTQEGWIVGPAKFLDLLSKWLGSHENFQDKEYIRVETYRKAVQAALQINQEMFFAASFEADAFSTAQELLIRRDELLLAGYDFGLSTDKIPDRLAAFSQIEALLHQKDYQLPRGHAEIMTEIMHLLPGFSLPISKIELYEPFESFPFCWQKVILILSDNGIEYVSSFSSDFKNCESGAETDLRNFQKMLHDRSVSNLRAKVDGSILIVRARRETDLADWTAKVLKENTSFRPLCIVPETSRALDAAFVMEGLPAMGIGSASSARSALQLLKLATVFVWKPIDPFRIMEFLSLPVKPFDDRLAQLISQVMSEKPGIYSQLWAARIHEFWEKSTVRYQNGREKDLLKIKEQYQFWFERRRYEQNTKVPTADIIEIYEYLCKWAIETYSNKKSSTLLVLASQAEKIAELLKEMSEKELGFLELERIIRTIYKSSPVVLEEKQVDSLDFVHQGGAIASKAEAILWWNFTDHEQKMPLQFWYDEEITYLENKDCRLENRKKWNDLQIEHRNRTVFAAQQQLLLLVPASVQGKMTLDSPLMGYISSTFENFEDLVFDLDEYNTSKANIGSFFKLQDRRPIDFIVKSSPQPFIEISGLSDRKSYRNYESPTSLEELLYFPYKWAFNYKARLNPGAILSVSKDARLLGNLAHRVFELLLMEDFGTMTQQQLNLWMDTRVPDILFKEGATFLMYGREQEKSRLIYRLKYAAWSLISVLNNNNWRVLATEQKVEGQIDGIELKAKLDLVLERGNEKAIVDLKWSGLSSKKELLKNREDLQLALYAELYKENTLPYTAFFIIDKGKMLARNKVAFKEAEIVNIEGTNAAEIHNEIMRKIMTTYNWRLSQLDDGLIEIRTAANVRELELEYESQQVNLLEMLEMKRADASWDNYKVLIKGIQ
ncbi:MAG: RecB family exonuclease [Saprospiraceae bacterium]